LGLQVYQRQITKGDLATATLASGGAAAGRQFAKEELRDLFSLRDLRTKQQLDSIADATVGDAEVGSDSEPSVLLGNSDESEVEFDSDDEMADRKRRIMDVEKNLDYL